MDEKTNLKSTLLAMELRQSNVACKMAGDIGITGYFFSDELPFDDPRLNRDDVQTYHRLDDKIYELTWKLSEIERTSERHAAMRDCFDLINLLNLEEGIAFLRKCGCRTTFELVDKLIENPNLIEEVALNE